MSNLNIILIVLSIGFLILFLSFRNKYLKTKKEFEEADLLLKKKFKEADLLLKKWNVPHKERILIEKQKRKIKN